MPSRSKKGGIDSTITGNYLLDRAVFSQLLNREVSIAFSNNEFSRVGAFFSEKNGFSFYGDSSMKYDLSNPEDATDLANLLCATTDLNSIEFDSVRLGGASATAFANMLNNKPFYTAKFSSAEITEQGWLAFASMLATNSTLQSLDLGSNTITPETVCILAKNLEHNTTLRKLDIDHGWQSKIDPSGATAIANMLKVNNALRELNLSGLKIQPNELITIITALQDNSTLYKLDITNNYIDDQCCSEFSKVLAINNSLTELHLCRSCAKIRDAGGIAIADAIATNTRLKILTIDIACINGQADCLKSFANMLAVNTSLEELTLHISMDEYDIDSNFIKSIFKSLEQNTTLRRLSIRPGDIQDTTVNAFIEFSKKNKTLEQLDFDRGAIGNKELIKMAQALQDNTSLRKIKFGNVYPKNNIVRKESAIAIICMLEQPTVVLQEITLGHQHISKCNNEKIGLIKERHVNKIASLLRKKQNEFLQQQFNTCFENVTHIPNDYETKIVSVLPEPSQHNQYVYFITPAGLFQLNYDNTDYMVILTAAQLEKISINTSHINKRLSDEQQTALNQLLLENNHCINSLDRQVAFLEHLVPGLMDESISPSSQEYWDEGYRLIKIIQRQHHFGSDIALYQLLTDSFTHAKWKNIVKEIIANLLFFASVFDRENIITTEQQLARCGLLVHYTKDQLETPEFKFAMLKITSPGIDFTIEQVQNYKHTFYPEYSEKEVDDMKQIIITLLIQANKDLEQLVKSKADSGISKMCVDDETSDTERDSAANDKISDTKKSPEVECVQSMHDGENIASIESAVIGTNTFVENSNILEGNIKGESVAETTPSDDINDIDKWKNTINTAIAKYLAWASPENSGDKRSRFVIFTSFNHGNQGIENANNLQSTINSAESIDTVKENLSKFLQQYHKLNKHSCGTFILNELKEKKIDYQPLPTKRNTYSN